MIDLTGYDFEVAARAPKAEGLTLQSVVDKAAREVFVGWPGKWETKSWQSGYDAETYHYIEEGLQLIISIFVGPTTHHVSIAFDDSVSDDDVQLSDMSGRHANVSSDGNASVDSAFANTFHHTLKKSVAEAKKSILSSDSSRAKQVSDIIERWKS